MCRKAATGGRVRYGRRKGTGDVPKHIISKQERRDEIPMTIWPAVLRRKTRLESRTGDSDSLAPVLMIHDELQRRIAVSRGLRSQARSKLTPNVSRSPSITSCVQENKQRASSPEGPFLTCQNIKKITAFTARNLRTGRKGASSFVSGM